jgi:Flp pilus assembly pilin Flp
MRNRKGQSILEYVIILTVIVAAIALAAGTMIKPSVNRAMSDVGGTINGATGRLPQSY